MGFWILLIFISLASAVKKECPNKTYKCPDSATCCQLLDKSFGCCPMENAVCCDDHIHCCPQNFKCSTGLCLENNNRSVEMQMLRNKDVICDDQLVCPDETTCCKNPHTQTYGCCPYENADCCDDGLHCCPEFTKCNLEEKRCDGDGYFTHMYDSQKNSFRSISYVPLSPLRSNKESSVICPGEQSQCPDGYTCCKLPNQDYGCCPFVKATCCKDGLHCCPEHMHCDKTSQYCSQGLKNVSSLPHIPAKKIPPTVTNICPDFSICDGLETCCESILFPPYGCCVYPFATCCEDRMHCCPPLTECCSDFLHCCPVSYTCCNDGLHCCPEDTKCNLEEQRCDGDGYFTPMYDSQKNYFHSSSNITFSRLHSNKESSVICPGKKSQCPDGHTCCKLPNQDYGCCPFVKATCCKDGLHCCPEHMHCDETSQYCTQGPRNISSLHHIPGKKIPPTVTNVCPDHSSCEDFETCCKSSSSSYGCCSYANATCCSDQKHCCPNNMVCDVEQKRCLGKHDLVVAFLNNMV